LIAGIALANGLYVATRNLRDFKRIKGLSLVSNTRFEDGNRYPTPYPMIHNPNSGVGAKG